MVSISESGYARIVANTDRLIEAVLKLGKDFAPSNPGIFVEALRADCLNCKKAMDDVGTAALQFRVAVKDREAAFEDLNALSSRIYNTLKVSDKSGKSAETAVLYLRKIQGRRATAKRSEAEINADSEAGIKYTEVSASQMSYDSRAENFGMLVKLALLTSSFSPNEPDLKKEALQVKYDQLKQQNAAVASAASVLFKARAFRNELLYKEATGLVDKAIDVKTYLKGAFGTKSPQYREVSGIYFKRISRN